MAKAEVVSTDQWAEDFGLTQATCRYATAIAPTRERLEADKQRSGCARAACSTRPLRYEQVMMMKELRERAPSLYRTTVVSV